VVTRLTLKKFKKTYRKWEKIPDDKKKT
jgi:hypothetical protein